MATYEETKTALEGAIWKWLRISEGKYCDDGARNCPLCRLFAQDGCYGCPIVYESGRDGCSIEQYVRWHYHVRHAHQQYSPYRVMCEKCKAYALSMANYLISLRPVVDKMFGIQGD